MLHVLDDMRELEYHAQNQPGGQVHGEESDQDLPPGESNDEERDDERVAIVGELGPQEHDDLRRIVLLIPVRSEVSSRELLIVLDEDPEQRRARVQRKRVEMLPAVKPILRRVRRESQQG